MATLQGCGGATTTASPGPAPIQLPDCSNGTVNRLDARPYFQAGKGGDGQGCSFIGQPGTTIVGGLRWDWFPSLGGSIHFDGGEISSENLLNITGENISFTGCELTGGRGVWISGPGHVSITNSSVTVRRTTPHGNGITIVNATISLASSSLGGLDNDGCPQPYGSYLSMGNSMATMVDVKVWCVFSVEFDSSRLIAKGLTSIQGNFNPYDGSPNPFVVSFMSTSATFQHGTDVITANDAPLVQAYGHSSVTFKNCTSLGRAIHNSTTKPGKVDASAGSQVSCIPPGEVLVV